MIRKSRTARRILSVLAASLLSSFVLVLPGCNPEGVDSAPKMKGNKDEIQKEGTGLPITPGKAKGRRSR